MRRLTLVALLSSLSYLPGCSGRPSTQELMMRAAERARPKDIDQDVDGKVDIVTSVKGAEKDSGTSLVSSLDRGELPDGEPSKPTETPTQVLESLGDLGLKPIQERRFAELAEENRRVVAAENLAKIAGALGKYHDENGHYPPRFIKSAGGLPTLSWRVQLLPYLGYKKLYDKFDFERPWNHEPNKTLINYMPPEFMSPERHDLKTNFQLPAYRTFLFGVDHGRRKQDVVKEDGLENTILLLEVNDDLAVEWISPKDYEPDDLANLKKDIGSVRGEGTFAVWANGWSVMLANALTNTQIANALTYDSGDGQLASAIHRDIPTSSSDASNATASSHDSGDNRSVTNEPQPSSQIRTREIKPKADEIAKAQAKLRKIFAGRIAQASEDVDRSKLAGEMIDSARTMSNDRAGAFVLQNAAMTMSSGAGDLKHVLGALDQRIGRFEVDAYDENMRALLGFAESTSRREPSEVDGAEYLKRAVPVIYAAIEDNDFVRGGTLARHCYRLHGQDPSEEVMVSLNRLRVLMSSAKREYDKSAAALAAYRSNPGDVESGAAFGRFLCFIKGDWEMGLPLVVQGGNEDLREIAKMDLRCSETIGTPTYGDRTYEDQIQIGDAWWQLASRTRNGVYRQAARDRAANWYHNAWPHIPESLDRLHVKNRLDELKNKTASSPIALIQQIADQAGVDLRVSLASIADVGQGRASNLLDD